MAKPVGRHRPKTSPRGDTAAMCSYCGVVWHRSDLRRDGAGLLVCPDDRKGRDIVTLTRDSAEQARRATARREHVPPFDTGPTDKSGPVRDGESAAPLPGHDGWPTGWNGFGPGT